MSELIKVSVSLTTENSNCEHDIERLMVREADRGTYTAESIPWFARHLDRGDCVTISPVGGELFIKEILRKSGHVTYHVRLTENIHQDGMSEFMTELREAIRSIGCDIEENGTHFFSVDVPPDVPALAVKELPMVGGEAELLVCESSFAAFAL